MRNNSFKFYKCTNELLNRYKQNKEIEMFNLGSFNEGNNYTLYVSDEVEDKKTLVFLSMSFEEKSLEIDEFEVVKSQRNKGIGKAIILNIQQSKEIDCIQLYAQDNISKKFWEKCNFLPEDDGLGTELMVWRKE